MSERESLLIKLKILEERSPDLLRAHYDHQSSVEELELIYQLALTKAHADKVLSNNKRIVVGICCAMEILHKKRTLFIEEILKATTYTELERLFLACIRSMVEPLSVENRSPEELELIEMLRKMRMASSLSEIIGIVLSKSHPIQLFVEVQRRAYFLQKYGSQVGPPLTLSIHSFPRLISNTLDCENRFFIITIGFV